MNSRGDRVQALPGAVAVAIVLAALLTIETIQAAARAAGRGEAPGSGARLRRPGLPAAPDMRIDLNHAAAPELAVLPGIGPGLAQRIIDRRASDGPFRSLHDLAVPGLSARTIEQWRGLAMVGEP